MTNLFLSEVFISTPIVSEEVFAQAKEHGRKIQVSEDGLTLTAYEWQGSIYVASIEKQHVWKSAIDTFKTDIPHTEPLDTHHPKYESVMGHFESKHEWREDTFAEQYEVRPMPDYEQLKPEMDALVEQIMKCYNRANSLRLIVIKYSNS